MTSTSEIEKTNTKFEEKILIVPCSGIGKSLGSMTRWAATELHNEICPELTKQICLAQLVAGDQEPGEIVQEYQAITLDGCPKKCASKLLRQTGGTILNEYLMARFLVKHRELRINTKDVSNPGENAEKLAKIIAKEIYENDLQKFNNKGENL
ncbi:MAG: putative zinc-binding protein [Promethearchaeota archaeon]